MKRKILQTRTAKTIFALLALFVCLLPSLLRGQTQDYISNKNNILIGTSDTRLTASIYETNDAVTIKLMAIGYLKVDMLSFSFFYNPAELRFCDQNLVEITAFNALQANAAVLSSELTQKGWLLYGTHKNAGLNPLPAYSGHQTMRAVLFDLVSPSSLANLVFEVPAGTVKNVLEFNFKKQTSGKALSEDAIGIAVKTSPVAYQPRFGYDGLFLWYRQEINSLDNREINPNLFLYRSGSSVATYAADPVSLTSATLNGNFLGGAVNLPVSTSILDTTGSATSGTGRLNHDAIQKYGFIYTTSDVNISISEFSDSIKIQNVMYALPTAGEIAAKAFSRGGYNFVIALNDNTLNEPDKNYAIPVLGLTPGENYYAWAYINYNFETSNTYQSVGQRITFTTDYCMAMNIGTVFTVEEPLCNSNNGKIQMFVTGGSGIYEFQIDGGAFKKYDNDIITGLYAGTYTITVRDSLAPVCPSSSIHNVVLHNSATDLNVSLTAQNAATCLDNGTLYVTVTGGVAPYKYYLNNEITETQIPYGMIANKPVGVYTLKVVDGAGCVATSSEVRINADDSNFTAEVLVLDNTTCGESAGRVIMLANSTTPITFQIDGYPEQIWEDYLDLPLLLGDVWSAGVHHIRLNNGCNEIIKEFTVTNGDDALAFKAVPVNEILSCNNALLPGSIILTIENGSGNYQYRIDGGQWQDFITGTTITGLHYGTYRVEIIDTDDDCMYEVNNITIGRETYAPIQVGTIFASKEPACGASNGEITVYATGGSGVYEYSADGVNFTQNNVIGGLKAGTYTITVKDVKYSTCSEVTIPNIVLHNSVTDLNISLTAQNAATCLDNGTLYVSVTGGMAPYKYYLNNETTETQIPYGMINKPVGVYTLKVVDDAGCVATSSEVRINADDSKLAAVVLVTEEAICGSSIGTISVTVENSTDFTYQLDGYPEETVTDYDGTAIIINGLSAGVHYLRVTDACNEIVEKIFITNGTNALAFDAVPANEILSCNNVLLPGSITLTVTNGSGNYQYRIDGGNWQNFISGTTIPGLHYGIYRVEIMDLSNHCTYEVNNITIGRETYAPIQVGTIFASKEPACGASNGEITVYATGGSGVYEYSADGVTFTPNNVIGGLKAGTYTITVKDVKYPTCSEVTIPNIVLHNSVTDLNISLTAQNAATCLDNGTLYATVTGGVAPYKYYLNNEITETQIPYGMINKPVGVYTLKVVDDAGCVATSSEVRINADDSKLAAVVLVTEEAICGSSIGTISVTVENSTDFTYQLDGYPEETVTDYDGTAIIINGLSAGIHYLRVTDACNEIVEKIIITNGNNALAFDAVPANEILSCNNVLLPGSIILTVTNGSGNYQYRIDGGNWQNFISGTTIPGLHYGIYRVEIMDLNNHCTYEVNNITIGRETYAPIQVGTIFASKEPACGASNGEITVYATGGSGVYEYSADGVNFTQNNVIGGLKAGTYTITVKDVKYPTCSEVTIPNIVLHNSVTDLNISLTAQNAATCLDNGTLQITVNGGKTPYKYYFNNEVTETIVTNGTIDKPVGTYTVKVVDNAGCVASSSEVRINADDSKLAAVVLVTEEAICGSSIGTISVTVENSTDFTYQLDGYPEETVTDYDGTAIIINGLSAGIHYLRVTDACNEIVEKIIITNGTDALAFDAVPANETLTCDGELTPGSITLTVSDGAGEYQYSINGATWVDFPASSSIAIIDKLQYGTYQVIVRDLNKCTYEVNNITISRETSYGTLITAPVATSPQTFCSTATVANLQATGVNIHWYLTETGGEALKLTDVLLPDTIYYAAQAFGTCESSVRTAVRVFINDDVVLETPKITSPQYLCGTAGTLELSDIVTDGNTNIVWYPFATTGSPLPMDTKLTDGTTYYAVIEAGDCQSAPRVPVVVHFTSTAPDSVAITSPQYFCEGALIGNIAVPNDHIVWYTAKTGGTALPTDYVLENNTTYFAAQMAGSCESEARTPVLVQFSAPDAPVMPAVQGICGKSTLADLVITGAGIVWYDQEVLGNILPLSTKLEVGKSYWAAQTSLNCEGKRAEVTITDTCYTVYGTMFPFVHMGNAEFDDKFPVTVSLFEVPTGATGDPVTEILNSTPVQTVKASFYDGTVYIPGTPKSPGVIGNTNNPGEEINWAEIGRSKDIVDNTPVTKLDNQPDKPVGMYKFENIVPGDYILEISRLGFVTRWGLVTIDKHGMTLGHRELIAGDVNGDFIVTNADASNLYSGEYDESDPNYDPRFDVNGDGNVNSSDMQIILYNLNANIGTYMETLNWINSYYE